MDEDKTDLMEVGPDKQIAFLVKNTLDKDPHTMTKDISVTCRDGLVTLQGVVDSLAEKVMAEEMAFAVDDVKAVENALVIADASEDDDVEGELLDALEDDPDIDTGDVSGMVRGGTAFLMGVVASSEYEHHAIEVASRARGVVRVVSMLRVGDGDSTPIHIPPGTPGFEEMDHRP